MNAQELRKDPFNIIIAGVGGQGNVLMSFLIGKALIKSDYSVTIFDNYGASQRLGAVASHIKISQEPFNTSPLLHEGDADVIVGIEPVELLRNLIRFGNPEVIAIMNTRPVYPIGVISGNLDYPDLDTVIETIRRLSAQSWIVNATEEALRLGNPLYTNVILLGALLGSKALPLDRDTIEEVLKEDWLWTGDLGYFDEDGFLVVTGRAKALLIAPDGEKHSPEEIEEAIINNCDLVSQVMVYNDHRKFTTGLITLQAEPARKALAAAGAADARQALEAVSDQWIPSVFEIIPDEFSEENGLVNSTMKLVRYRVAEFYKERIEAMYADNNFFNERNLAAMEKLFGYPIR